jgi:glutathione peroxidase
MSQTIYDFEAVSIDGKPAHLGSQRGKVLLIVNTASACGFTPQFAGWKSCGPTTATRAWWWWASRATSSAPGPGQQRRDRVVLRAQLRRELSDDGQGAGQRHQAHPLWKWLKAEAPGVLGSEEREVELHQVPGRPRRQGDQALRPQRHPRVAARDIEGRPLAAA